MVKVTWGSLDSAVGMIVKFADLLEPPEFLL